jgi:hypothetical protein
MKKPDVCEVCGRPVSTFSRSYVCSAACRKRKSRMNTEAGLNLIKAKNAIREVIKGLELDVITTGRIYSEFYPLQNLVNELADAYNARFHREQAEQERKAEAGSK